MVEFAAVEMARGRKGKKSKMWAVEIAAVEIAALKWHRTKCSDTVSQKLEVQNNFWSNKLKTPKVGPARKF